MVPASAIVLCVCVCVFEGFGSFMAKSEDGATLPQFFFRGCCSKVARAGRPDWIKRLRASLDVLLPLPIYLSFFSFPAIFHHWGQDLQLRFLRRGLED